MADSRKMRDSDSPRVEQEFQWPPADDVADAQVVWLREPSADDLIEQAISTLPLQAGWARSETNAPDDPISATNQVSDDFATGVTATAPLDAPDAPMPRHDAVVSAEASVQPQNLLRSAFFGRPHVLASCAWAAGIAGVACVLMVFSDFNPFARSKPTTERTSNSDAAPSITEGVTETGQPLIERHDLLTSAAVSGLIHSSPALERTARVFHPPVKSAPPARLALNATRTVVKPTARGTSGVVAANTKPLATDAGGVDDSTVTSRGLAPSMEARTTPATPIADAKPATEASRPRATSEPPIPSGVQDERNIRAVLQRYAVAYEQLDAYAARAVWPTVDVRALSKAFSGLESQDVTFNNCLVNLSGSDARATCHGTATYVPRVGNKDPRTLQRDWVFRLRKSGDNWTIATSETR